MRHYRNRSYRRGRHGGRRSRSRTKQHKTYFVSRGGIRL